MKITFVLPIAVLKKVGYARQPVGPMPYARQPMSTSYESSKGYTLSLTGGIRVVSIFAELLRKRGHSVFVISLPHPQPSMRQQVKLLLQGRGWISPPENEPSFFDNLPVEHKITDRYRPVEDKDVPDADVVVATWWETPEWVAKLSPSKGAKAYFFQGHEVFDYLPQAIVLDFGQRGGRGVAKRSGNRR